MGGWDVPAGNAGVDRPSLHGQPQVRNRERNRGGKRMQARLDTALEIHGGFSETPNRSCAILGQLLYEPDKGVELILGKTPEDMDPFASAAPPFQRTFYGWLSDGTLVTLYGCFITSSTIHIGPGLGSPTRLRVTRALFGRHVADPDALPVRQYRTELSSLAQWTCSQAIWQKLVKNDTNAYGLDVTCRQPATIEVRLPEKDFDFQITHALPYQRSVDSFAVNWRAAVTVAAHDNLALRAIQDIAWQCGYLLTLLVGHPLTARAIVFTTAQEDEASAEPPPLQLLYKQRGQEEQRHLHPAEMMLPYAHIKDLLPSMVKKWFERSEQAVLATNVFFGSQSHQSPSVNVKFLAITQSVESYHRSLGTGLYMDQALYEESIDELCSHMPAVIQGAHRRSVKSRLRYGNEYSLRKRLSEMFGRLPDDARSWIANNVETFIDRTVDTRNYFTHYDRTSESNALKGKDAYIAAERLRILLVANLLMDLGIEAQHLMKVLMRNQEFQHWSHQDIAL